MDLISFIRNELACSAGRRECARSTGAAIVTCLFTAGLCVIAYGVA